MPSPPSRPPRAPSRSPGASAPTSINAASAPASADARHVITQPGSYCLAGDIDAGTLDGVHIAASNVTLDLNGYTIRGQRSGSGRQSRGVTVPGAVDGVFQDFSGVVLRNGHITGFDNGIRTSSLLTLVDERATEGSGGVEIADNKLLDTAFEDLLITGVGGGISSGRRGQGQVPVSGFEGGRIVSCVIQAERDGIDASGGAVTDCVVRLTGPSAADGIRATDAVVRGCAVSGPGLGFRLRGVSIADGCVSISVGGNAVEPMAQTFSSNF